MMISTKDAKNTTIIKAPNFAFKLNLHIQVDSRINWYIHVIDTMWSTNIFQFFSAPRIDNLRFCRDKSCQNSWWSQTNFVSPVHYVITTSNETQHPWKITLSQGRFYPNIRVNYFSQAVLNVSSSKLCWRNF